MIKIITVGKLTHKYLKEGLSFFEKQIPQKTSWIEVSDASNFEGVKLEGERILKHVVASDYVITLEIEGAMLSSEDFAKKMDEILTYEQKHITFIIGGSYGISKEVSNRSDFKLSFSKMTFPHQLMRLYLIEQIYRAFMILKNHPYHK